MKLRPISHLIAASFVAQASFSHAATFTWDGGGSDGKTSTANNWATDTAPNATGDSLVFAGSTGTTVDNDFITTLGSNSFNFASGAASFQVGSSAGQIVVGNSGGNDNFVTKVSTNDQTIAANIRLAGGGRDRTIVMTGGGTLTLSGNIDFNNDWLFPTTSAGTIILSGNNTGDGKGGIINAGTNTTRAMFRNNVAGTILSLGSDTALGASGSGSIAAGSANFRGIVANQNMTLTTSGDNRNLSGSSLIINAANVTFQSAKNLILGNLIVQGGNRDLWVTGAGSLTIQSSIALSNDQTGRNLYANTTSSGALIVNGAIHDSFHSGGLTSGTSTLRKAGSGSMELNGDSSTFAGTVRIEGGTLKLGHANALGNTTGTTSLEGATLDLNGQAIGETVSITAASSLINSSTSASSVTADISVGANTTINTTGNMTVARLIGNSIRLITKTGAGTLTTSGSSHNSLIAWDIQAGKVIFANSSGIAADRSVILQGGTLQLSGSNSNLINDNESFTIQSGTFDLNGKTEAVASIAGNGGIITNTNSTAATLYVGGGSSGTSSASYAGALQDGTGILHVHKEGTGTQTFTGTSTYTGTTTVSAGTLLVNGQLGDTAVTVGAAGTVGGSGQITGSVHFADGAKLSINLADPLAVTGAVTFTNFGFDDLVGFDVETAAEGTYTLISGTAISLDNVAYTISNPFARADGKFAYFQTGSLQAVITAVPETSSVLLAAFGALSLFRRRRL